MSFIQKTARSFLWNYLNKIGTYGLEFLLSIILARGLGSYYFGIYNEFLNFVYLFSFICTLGLDTALNIYLPKQRESLAIKSGYIRTAFRLVFFSSILGMLILLIFRNLIGELIHSPAMNKLLIIAAVYILFYNFFIVIQSILFAEYRTKSLFFYNSLLRLFYITASLLSFMFKWDLTRLLALFTGLLLVVSLMLVLSVKKNFQVSPEKIDKKEFLSFSINSWMVKLVNYFLGRYFDIFLLGVYNLAKQETSYYSTAVTLTMSMAYLFSAPFSGISMSAFSEMASQQNFNGIAKGWNIFTKTVSLGCIPLFLFVVYYANDVMEILYSAEFLPAAALLQIFAGFYLLTLLLGSGTNSTILFALNKDKILLRLRILFGLLNVVLDVILIPLIGTKGAIIATGISITGIILTELFLVKKYVEIRFPFLFVSKVLLTASVALAATLLIPFTGILWIIKPVAFIVLLLFLFYIIKPLEATEYNILLSINEKLAMIFKPFIKIKE